MNGKSKGDKWDIEAHEPELNFSHYGACGIGLILVEFK